jgi:hypothetical protein
MDPDTSRLTAAHHVIDLLPFLPLALSFTTPARRFWQSFFALSALSGTVLIFAMFQFAQTASWYHPGYVVAGYLASPTATVAGERPIGPRGEFKIKSLPAGWSAIAPTADLRSHRPAHSRPVAGSALGFFGLTRSASAFALGTISVRSSSRLALRRFMKLLRPVTLPPGELVLV